MENAITINTEDKLSDAISQLIDMQEDGLIEKSVGLYRAMFRHEMDVNKLDFNYADWIFDYVSIGNENAIEDYKNYIQYLKCFNQEEYLYHKQMLNKKLSEFENGNHEEEQV